MENTQIRLSEEFKGYKEMLGKQNIFLSDFDNLNENYTITMTQNTYKKLGRKNFPTKPTETETKEITARQYACYLTSIGFFGDKVYKTYTEFGYKPYRIVCKNPNEEVKIERKFSFKFNK